MKNEEVEDGVEGKVKDMHNPFEDSKEAFEGATVSLKEDEGGNKASFSEKHVSLSRKNLRVC